MEEKNNKEKTNYFTLLALLLIVGAMIFSYFKYYVNLDYDTLLAIECDPSENVCFYDEESYYQKFLVYTKTLDENCNDSEDEQCIIDLWQNEMATLIECSEDTLESWEVCSDPNEYEEEDGDEDGGLEDEDDGLVEVEEDIVEE
jgi:hypothetical protein